MRAASSRSGGPLLYALIFCAHHQAGIVYVRRIRRHQPRSPPQASTRPGRPAPTTGPGTAAASKVKLSANTELPFNDGASEPNSTYAISAADTVSVCIPVKDAGINNVENAIW